MSEIHYHTIHIDGRELIGSEGFHDTFAKTMDFPNYYGRNMDAWIDCMGDRTEEDKVIALQIENYKEFKEAAPKQWLDLIECAAFVNWRQTNHGGSPILALSFYE